jgi:hypothetical protein
MPAKLVILAPYYEVATKLWSPFLRGWVKNELEKRKVETVLLWGDDANRQKLWEAVKNPEIRGILGVGHGSETEIVGQNNETLLKVGDSIGPEWRKLCFAPVSCLVGQKLVPWLVEQGVPCGVGEETEYWFTAEDKPREGNDPEEDQLLKYYLRAEYTYWFRLAEGFTAGQAYQMMLDEYEKQAKLAQQVDPETAYWLRYDAKHRKFFGDGSFLLTPGVRTKVDATVTAVRDARGRKDDFFITGRVVAEDGSTPKGWVEVWVNDNGATVPLEEDGSFSWTTSMFWTRNEEKLYAVAVIYNGYKDDKVYLPSRFDTQVKVEPITVPTVLTITDARASRDGPIVFLDYRGRLYDYKGNPLPGKSVAVSFGDGELREEEVVTDDGGAFQGTLSKIAEPLQTKATVRAWFRGDDVYQGSSDTKVVSFPPNWEAVIPILAALLAGALVLALLLASIL